MTKSRELELLLDNVDCPNEAKAIERGFASFPGVTNLSVFAVEGRALVSFDESVTTAETIKAQFASLGFPPRGAEASRRAQTGAVRPRQTSEKDSGRNHVTVFSIPKMDCPSEEQMIRMAVGDVPSVKKLTFDLPARELRITHTGNPGALLALLAPLKLGAKLSLSRDLTDTEEAQELAAGPQTAVEARVLKQLLAINGTLFVLEIGTGLYAQSAGLIADSLDMFADAVVYGLSLYAVGRALSMKQRAARISGYLQLVLALGAVAEVVRRFAFGSEPLSVIMMGMAALAMIANVSCLVLLARHRGGEVHMRASWIFSTNDVIANLGVIIAGVLVYLSGSALPDLVIGAIIAAVVFSGSMRILRMAKTGERAG